MPLVHPLAIRDLGNPQCDDDHRCPEESTVRAAELVHRFLIDQNGKVAGRSGPHQADGEERAFDGVADEGCDEVESVGHGGAWGELYGPVIGRARMYEPFFTIVLPAPETC